MKVINLGSLNVDYVYRVDEFLLPGETRPSKDRTVHAGGKGLNQSIALARAGAEVYHAGIIGNDGAILRDTLVKNGVRVDFLASLDEASGHTIIQVNDAGENKIILYGGTNRQLSARFIDNALDHFGSSDVLLVQNETNLVGYAIEKARARGMKTVFNAAPITREITEYPLEYVDWLIVNEIEGAALAGTDAASAEPEKILNTLASRYPSMTVFLTLGAAGCRCAHDGGIISAPAFPVDKDKIVDTTAAGDTFTGYLLQSLINGRSVKDAMVRASAASALAIQKLGASSSIPFAAEVDGFTG
ncbi:MAG: ribokinase [Treponema sp.]|jgi:ribokinase|nr:ribokinase [Treponema sp.]